MNGTATAGGYLFSRGHLVAQRGSWSELEGARRDAWFAPSAGSIFHPRVDETAAYWEARDLWIDDAGYMHRREGGEVHLSLRSWGSATRRFVLPKGGAGSNDSWRFARWLRAALAVLTSYGMP